MLASFMGKMPSVAGSAFISEAAYIIGDVEIGEGCSIWPGAVIRGDTPGGELGGRMTIGPNSHIEDNVTIHFTKSIGERVVIGHGAVIEAISIGDNVLVGDNATMLAYSRIGNNCMIAAGAMMKEGMEVPDNSFVTGSPARIKSGISQKQVEMIDEIITFMTLLISEHNKSTVKD